MNSDIIYILRLKPVNDLRVAVTDFQARSEEREFSWLDIWVCSVGDNNWNSNYDSFLVLRIGNCGSFLWLAFQWRFPELAAKRPPRRRFELSQQPSGEKRVLGEQKPKRRSCYPTQSKSPQTRRFLNTESSPLLFRSSNLFTAYQDPSASKPSFSSFANTLESGSRISLFWCKKSNF